MADAPRPDLCRERGSVRRRHGELRPLWFARNTDQRGDTRRAAEYLLQRLRLRDDLRRHPRVDGSQSQEALALEDHAWGSHEMDGHPVAVGCGQLSECLCGQTVPHSRMVGSEPARACIAGGELPETAGSEDPDRKSV